MHSGPAAEIDEHRVLDLVMGRKRGMTQGPEVETTQTAAGSEPVQEPLAGSGTERSGFTAVMLGSSVGRNLGLVVALFVLCIVGVATAGEQFASIDNALTILRLASVIGVVSIGMTFVITGGGIDLSVGAIVALSSVWATHPGARSRWREATTGPDRPGGDRRGDESAGLINGLLIAYGKVVPFIATLAMLAAARGLAEIIAQRRTQIVDVPGFTDFFRHDVLGVPLLVIIFVVVSAIGWVVLNRTTFGRRTFAVGGNPRPPGWPASTSSGTRWPSTSSSGCACGIAAVMIVAKTTTGSSTHGTLGRAGTPSPRS